MAIQACTCHRFLTPDSRTHSLSTDAGPVIYRDGGLLAPMVTCVFCLSSGDGLQDHWHATAALTRPAAVIVRLRGFPTTAGQRGRGYSHVIERGFGAAHCYRESSRQPGQRIQCGQQVSE